MSVLKKPINYEGLEEELQESLRADNMYQLQNDAKLRAIEQNVPTYEHFRQIVCGAHLKPLEPKDTCEKSQVSWNSIIKSNRLNNEIIRSNNSSRDNNYEKSSKATGEFYKSWKEIDNVEDKIQFLYNTRNSLPQIFQVEIPTNILEEFLTTCLSMENDEDKIIEILHVLSKCNRFKLTMSFMNHENISVYKELFDNLMSKLKHDPAKFNIVDELAKKYFN